PDHPPNRQRFRGLIRGPRLAYGDASRGSPGTGVEMADPLARGLRSFFSFDNSFEARNRLHFSGGIEREFHDFSFELLVLLLSFLSRGIECVGTYIGDGFLIRGPQTDASRDSTRSRARRRILRRKDLHADGGVPGDRQTGRPLRVRSESGMR